MTRITDITSIAFITILIVLFSQVNGAWLQEESASAVSTPAPAALIYSAEPGPDVLTLQEIAADAATDAEILAAVVSYYSENQERLSVLWREEHPDRLAALFSMYVVHISTIYGETTFPTSVSEYLTQERAHCGTYTWTQFQIANALGLTRRTVEFVGEHAWLEVYIDDHWELFDATTNTWMNRGVDTLLRGEPREYRQFYTPLLDIDRPDARLHMSEGYDMQRLRQRMPTMGIIYMPPGEMIVGEPSRDLE